MLFKATKFVAIGYSSSRKLLQVPYGLQKSRGRGQDMAKDEIRGDSVREERKTAKWRHRQTDTGRRTPTLGAA